MTKSLLSSAAALALGLGLASAPVPTASAETAPGARQAEGGHIATRSRGRVHGGPRVYHGGHYGHRRHHGGRYVAGGIAAGIAGAIILNEIARSSRPTYYYSESRGLSCGELEYRCDRGQDWACRRLDRDPDC